ncbi:MAG: hypothetical protein HY094_02520 [Candidatus Melainabacteria bacterium]|nr:hypothetical protein [Candidatus Melainabacteria bacterium]
MSEAMNSANNNQKVGAILASNSDNDKLESNSQKKIADKLLNESSNYSKDSRQKAEQARELLSAAEALSRLASAVRAHAEQIRSNPVKKTEESAQTQKTIKVLGKELEMPIPKNATPEQLENMAKDLEDKAKENRRKADDLLIDSEKHSKLAAELEKQAKFIEGNVKISDVQMKLVQAHNEGLNMVFKKLGIYTLDAEYRRQVESSVQKRAAQDQLREKA